ncbi:MAG: hypothetical protein HYS32_04490 [Candidatus Woesearchaeota archaeon]|nr:MAG: hypothetical protein HYS32_04490 [Candidatus Woesearchaeota archaeon]
MPLVVYPKEVSINDKELLGEKAATIAELYNLKFPVPLTFFITIDAFACFLKENNLKEKIKFILKDLNVENEEQLKQKSVEIQKLILSAEIPKKLRHEILEAYENLNVDEELLKIASKDALSIIKTGRDPLFVAVKLSPTENFFDSAPYSQLNIKGPSNILEAVKKAWATLYTSKAIYYRYNNNIKNESTSIIIQKMVDAKKSGTILTLNNSNSELVITSLFGFNNKIAIENIKPDTYIINKDNLELKDKEITEKNFMITRNSAGQLVKREVPNPTAPTLNKNELEQITKLAIDIESKIKSAQEIEFAIEDYNKLQILQSKPHVIIEPKKQEVFVEEIQQAVETIDLTQHLNEIEHPEELIEQKIDQKTSTLLKINVSSKEHIVANKNISGVGLIKIDDSLGLEQNIEQIVSSFKDKPVWYFLNTKDYNTVKLELDTIRSLYDDGFTNIGIIVPFSFDILEIKKAKQLIRTINLEPLDEIEFGILLETPAAAHIIDDIAKEGVDFVSINIENLTKLTLGADKENPFYNELHPAVLSQIKSVIENCKKYNIETSVAISDDILKISEFLIKAGIDSISVSPEIIDEARTKVADIERKILLDVARKDLKGF